MFKVKNKKTIYRLSDKNFRAGKIRNSIAVIAIILTSVLFTALFTIASGMVENIQKQTMRQAGGDGMAVLKYITEEEYQNMILTMLEKAEKGEEIVFSQKDKQNEILMAKLAEQNVAVSEETRELEGGFIVKKGEIEYNYSFEAILTVEKENIEQIAAEILFA